MATTLRVSSVMDLFGSHRKRTTDKPSMAYVDEVITYLLAIDWRRISMHRKSHNVIGFNFPTSSVLIPEGLKLVAGG